MTFLKNYNLRLLLLSCGAFLLSLGLSQIHSRFFDCPHFYIITLFFAVTTFLANFVFKAGAHESRESILKIMAISMGRLLLCMVAVLIYSVVNKPQALGFACHFMIQYVLFTIFELSHLLKFVKQATNSNTNHP